MGRLDYDRMFIAVVEMGSFSKAAARLGTSSGHASKLVSHLEKGLGVRLLNRTTRALSPTEVGQAYFERIRLLLEELDSLDQSVKNQSGAASGTLRLTAPMSFGTEKLADALTDFVERYPAINLDVNFTDRIVNLVDEGFDAGIRIGSPSNSSLIVRKLCDARVVIGASPGYLASRNVPSSPHDLSNHDCIIDTNFREPFIWNFYEPTSGDRLSIDVKGRLRFSNADACLAAAEKGLGIARVPSFSAGPSFRAGHLVPLLELFEDKPIGVHVIYPPSRYLALKVRVLVDFLSERFQGEPEWDQGW